jgi:hypothetical protein
LAAAVAVDAAAGFADRRCWRIVFRAEVEGLARFEGFAVTAFFSDDGAGFLQATKSHDSAGRYAPLNEHVRQPVWVFMALAARPCSGWLKPLYP